MDANGTRYHLLTGFDDWAAATDEAHAEALRARWLASPPLPSDLEWEPQSRELRLAARVLQFAAAPLDTPPTLDQRRGAAADLFDNWYWIDESRRAILVTSSGDGATTQFWPPLAPEPCTPPAPASAFQPAAPPPAAAPIALAGLAVTETHLLVVGALDPAGLLVFDLHTGGPPDFMSWAAAIPFEPWDMAPMPGGGLWILDRSHRRVWALDRTLQPLRDDQGALPAPPPAFTTLDPGAASPTPAPPLPTGLALDASSPLDLADPIAIEGLPDCTYLILEAGAGDFARIHRYRFAQRLGPPASTEAMRTLIEEGAQEDFTLHAHDFAYAPAHSDADGAPVPDRLYIATTGGNQAFAFDLGLDQTGDLDGSGGTLTLRPLPDFYPMRLFGGRGLVTSYAGGAPTVHYDFAQSWIPLVAQRRPRFAPSAAFITLPLDGREPGCCWHRLILDGCLPPDAALTIWSRSAELRADLLDDPHAERIGWTPEPTPLRRATGSELPWSRPARGPHRGSWETLFQGARGRFLQLRIELAGNERVSPQLHALRVYYPRFSYLERYLPAVYRADAASASFLDRFLANIEGILTALEDRIAAVQLLFDAASAPPETLDWLAGWLGVALDPAWDEARRRLFLAHALDFFQWRGTTRGLLLALRLALDPTLDPDLFERTLDPAARASVRIVERYRTRALSPTALGDPTSPDALVAAPPQDRWSPAQGVDELHRRYRTFAGEPDNLALLYPITPPPAQAAWEEFSRAALGFVPAAPAARLDLWQGSLQRRYRQIDALNDAWALPAALRFTSFAAIPLPAALPGDGARLDDWFRFEALLLPMHAVAHRFSVLVPVARCAFDESETDRRRRLELARRVVELEKPAHTIFDVRFYFALFQIGAARLGEDTLLDQGSRAPELLRAFILGRDHLVEGYLSQTA